MGWASGSGIAADLIHAIEENVEDKLARRQLYSDMIDIFQTYDCDTLDECLGVSKEFDVEWKERNPDPEEENDDWSYDDED